MHCRNNTFLKTVKCQEIFNFTKKNVFFCNCTSSESTYHHQFWKCPCFPVPTILAIKISINTNETLKVLIFGGKYPVYTYSYLMMSLENIWNKGKNIQDLSGQ